VQESPPAAGLLPPGERSEARHPRTATALRSQGGPTACPAGKKSAKQPPCHAEDRPLAAAIASRRRALRVCPIPDFSSRAKRNSGLPRAAFAPAAGTCGKRSVREAARFHPPGPRELLLQRRLAPFVLPKRFGMLAARLWSRISAMDCLFRDPGKPAPRESVACSYCPGSVDLDHPLQRPAWAGAGSPAARAARTRKSGCAPGRIQRGTPPIEVTAFARQTWTADGSPCLSALRLLPRRRRNSPVSTHRPPPPGRHTLWRSPEPLLADGTPKVKGLAEVALECSRSCSPNSIRPFVAAVAFRLQRR